MNAPSLDSQFKDARNAARYFVEARQVTWVLLIAILFWGYFSYQSMEKRKDPVFSNLYAVAVCAWPGASAEKVEQLVTRKLEEKIAQNVHVETISSVARSNISIVNITLEEKTKDTASQFDDLKMRLDSIHDLPEGAGPVIFLKDFGEVTTLMLTVASPKAGPVEISLRAKSVARAIEKVRANSPQTSNQRLSIVVCYPFGVTSQTPQRQRDLFIAYLAESGFMQDVKAINGNGFVGVDGVSNHTDAQSRQFIKDFVDNRLRESMLHPDLWQPALIRNPAETEAALTAVAGDKYSYKELGEFSDLMQRTLQTVPEVSRVNLYGLLDEKIVLSYSQQALASYGLQPINLRERLPASNIYSSGGVMEVGGKNVSVNPSGAFKSERDIGNVIVATSPTGAPVYLRQLVEITRDYDTPARYLNYVDSRDSKGNWSRMRAITLAVYMRQQEKIDKFGAAVSKALDGLKQRLPEDLRIDRVSDQTLQVDENIELFMTSLYEAVVLVVLVAFVGFWEWRSALLIALSIPTTLAMTFGMMSVLGIDLQQVSIASLIIALGLLVDDPVVAGDAIKKCLAEGHSRLVAAWLGPTRLAHAIMYATITNIAAYLPFLLMPGLNGQFIYSLPIVITCALVASRLVSMSFVPLLGYYLLRAPKNMSSSGQPDWREKALAAFYAYGDRVFDARRWIAFASVIVLIIGVFSISKIKSQFFPLDTVYICWVDVWLPEGSSLTSTNNASIRAEDIVKKVAADYGKQHPSSDGKLRDVLRSITVYLGGGGPRFWFSILPELDQQNYAQLVLRFNDKHDTAEVIPLMQRALSRSMSEAMCDVRQIESGNPVGVPIQIRISGDNPDTLVALASKAASVLRASPLTERVRDDWGAGSFAIDLDIDSDRANLAGLTNSDIASSSLAGVSGYRVDSLREGDKEIPIVVRMRQEESAQQQGIKGLYAYSFGSRNKIPLGQVASLHYGIQREKIRRRNQFRTITVSSFPAEGHLASEAMDDVRPALQKFIASAPPGYKVEIGGEERDELQSFGDMALVMATSIFGIFLCLVIQFKNAVKPLLVFAGLPFGLLGALIAVAVMGKPFGFPAFMGVASLAGVIVGHVIVLFDVIEEKRREGEELRKALLDGILARWRPVIITVAATVFGLFPLASHGGPLWEPLCYAQIGGLMVATVSTLILVPVLYSMFVLDFKWIRWESVKDSAGNATGETD